MNAPSLKAVMRLMVSVCNLEIDLFFKLELSFEPYGLVISDL
jgi:hypothetical protein